MRRESRVEFQGLRIQKIAFHKTKIWKEIFDEPDLLFVIGSASSQGN